jgi:hypothetical protein
MSPRWGGSFCLGRLAQGNKVLVESPGKLVRERSLRQGLPKDLSLRKIDSVFPDNGAKMLSRNLYFRSQAIG